jgi:hypothetical protein
VQEIKSGVDRDGKPIAEPRITDKRTNVETSASSSTVADEVPTEVYENLPF